MRPPVRSFHPLSPRSLDFSRRFIDPRNVTSFIFILPGDFQAFPPFISKNSPLSLPRLLLFACNLSLTILAKNRPFHFPCNCLLVPARRTSAFNDRKNTSVSTFQIIAGGGRQTGAYRVNGPRSDFQTLSQHDEARNKQKSPSDNSAIYNAHVTS